MGDRWKAYKQGKYVINPHQTFYQLHQTTTTIPHMLICNAATVDNSVGSCAIYVTPDNQGEITRFDNQQHTQSVEDSCVNQSCGCGNIFDSI